MYLYTIVFLYFFTVSLSLEYSTSYNCTAYLSVDQSESSSSSSPQSLFLLAVIASHWIAVNRCGSPWIAVDRIVTLTFLPDFFSDAAFEKRSCIFCVPLVPLGRESANCCCCLDWKLELELELRRTLQMAMGKGRRGMGKGMDWQPFVKSFRQRILSASSLYP